MLDKDYRPSIRPDLQYRELEDGGVVYDTNAERIHTLNLAAAYVWNCCDGSHDLSDIASELHLQSNASREQTLQDVSDVLAYFQREGLLRVQ